MDLKTLLCIFAVTIASVSCASFTDLKENQEVVNSVENTSQNITMPEEAKEWMKKTLKEMCANVTDMEATYNRVLGAAETLEICVVNLFETNQIENQTVKTTSEDESDLGLDEYCAKRTVFFECLNEFVKALEPCMDAAEIDLNRLSIHIIHKLADFFCHENGMAIVRFVAENGLVCATEHQEQLNDCLDSTFKKYNLSEEDANATTTLYPMNAAALCNDLSFLHPCVVNQLKKCENQVPANLVDSMFDSILKDTVCKKQ